MLVLRLFIWNKATQDLEKNPLLIEFWLFTDEISHKGKMWRKMGGRLFVTSSKSSLGFNREHLTFLFISACSSLYRCSQNKTEATVVTRAPRPRLSRRSSDLWLPVLGNKTRGTSENGGSQTQGLKHSSKVFHALAFLLVGSITT